jgi:hypothetical protein
MSDDSNEPVWDASWLEENTREVEKDLESLELHFDNAEDDKAFEDIFAKMNTAEEVKAFDDMITQSFQSLSEADLQLHEEMILLAKTPKMTVSQLSREIARLIASKRPPT